MILHGYFRSTASWRVRIALGLKGLRAKQVTHHLRKAGQRAPGYLAINPQGLVPALELDDGTVITQSLAILDYIDRAWTDPPLFPSDPIDRALAQSIALAIACDIHPVQNLKVLARVGDLAGDESARLWAQQTIGEGLDAVEELVGRGDGRFCVGTLPTVADICLIPQMSNARRFGLESRWPRIASVETACNELAAFTGAAPDCQPDSE